MARATYGSGYPFEETYGYSRAVRVNDHVFVSGTTARGVSLDGTAYQQMRAILELIESALLDAGAHLRHVVRTVVYVTDLAFGEDIARAHRDVFAEIRPASTLVQVARLTPNHALVEVEATAVIAD